MEVNDHVVGKTVADFVHQRLETATVYRHLGQPLTTKLRTVQELIDSCDLAKYRYFPKPLVRV
jgi:hypothetical protein